MCERSQVDSGNGKTILGPVTGSPVGAGANRTRRSPVKENKGRLCEGKFRPSQTEHFLEIFFTELCR